MASTTESATVLLSDAKTGTKARASSVLQRNAKVYGPSHALNDGSSSWNSEGNNNNNNDGDDDSHWFRLDFGRVVQPTSLRLQFQAGFVAQQGRLEYQTSSCSSSSSSSSSSTDWKVFDDAVEWEDSHEHQTLPLTDFPPCTSVRLVLSDCTDFYGRVILYQIQVWGTHVA